jgi:hypothetical protein
LLPFSCGRRGWGMRVPRNISGKLKNAINRNLLC